MEIQPCGLLGDFVYRWTAVIDHAEGLAVGPLHVARSLVGELGDHFVDRSSLLSQRCHAISVAHSSERTVDERLSDGGVGTRCHST